MCFNALLALKVHLQIMSHLSLIHMTISFKHHFLYGLGIKSSVVFVNKQSSNLKLQVVVPNLTLFHIIYIV